MNFGLFEYRYSINETIIWSYIFANRFIATYPASDLNGDNSSEIIINSWNLSDNFYTDIYIHNGRNGDNSSEIIINSWNLSARGSADIFVQHGRNGTILWNRHVDNGLAVAYPASDLNRDNSSEIIIDAWNFSRNVSTDIFVQEGRDGTILLNKHINNGLAAAYPASDLDGDGPSEIIINSWNFGPQSSTSSIISLRPLTQTDLITKYDSNNDGRIDKIEAVQAVMDYFNGTITRQDAITVVMAYFSGE